MSAEISAQGLISALGLTEKIENSFFCTLTYSLDSQIFRYEDRAKPLAEPCESISGSAEPGFRPSWVR